MITIQTITLRNFLSIGAVCQEVEFDKKDLTLVLGENLDLGGDGARNGVGKSTLLQGLSYALFGVPINSIRKDNLVNRTNTKGMMVTLEFNVNGTDYKIERGRKPNILKFYVNNVEQKDEDTAQGENKATQEYIERVLNMTPEMFKHIVALNTYSEPFLALKANEQREIIEQLLGITLLSEKAEVVKTMLKETKDNIQQEEFKVKAVEEANKRVKEQIEATKRRQKLWQQKHDEDLENLAIEYTRLSQIDIVAELQAHKDLVVWNEKKKQQDTYNTLVARQTAWKQKQEKDIKDLDEIMFNLNKIDIVEEIKAHSQLATHITRKANLEQRDREIDRLSKDIDKEDKLVKKLIIEINTLKEHKCYACGQDFHDEQHTKVLNEKEKLLEDAEAHAAILLNQWNELRNTVIFVPEKPNTFYKTEAEAIHHGSELNNLGIKILEKQKEADPYTDQLKELSVVELGPQPITHYDTEAQAIEHQSKVINLEKQIEIKATETNPHTDVINEMENNAIQEINFDTINKLTKTSEHQKFLLDLLTSKDSFVRKKIIDQSLKFLNTRLGYYLDKIGLPHNVEFKNDLQVEITELGREMDFYNLSRGEMNRVILSLSWAFRDVWENLYSPINVLFIDELLDSGMDAIGIENSIGILKDMTRRRGKSIWVISHREDLSNRVNNVLKVVKSGGFTTYDNSLSVDNN